MSGRAVILGLGRSGEAAARLLQARGWSATILNSSFSTALRARAEALAKEGIYSITGADANTDSTLYDLCILSPGIDPAAPIVQNILRKDIPIIGEIELAFRECRIPIIAVTGTNGKTTTTELIATMLNGCGVHTRACGNIGLPFSEVMQQPSGLHVVVLEVSSFQLESIRKFRPHISVWLNLSPNHLDRYRSMEDYREAKLRIFLNQTPEDFAVVNARDQLPHLAAKRTTFNAYGAGADFTKNGSEILFQGVPVLDQIHTLLHGTHNTENLMAALATGHCLGIKFAEMARAISGYSPPEHRCELVRERGGVGWINDSKSTNLDSLEKAIQSQSAPLILIAGGKDKGFDFDPLAPLVAERVKVAVLIGEMRHRIAASWLSTPSKVSDTLEDAVHLAEALSKPGDVVLFSPGTSSFDMFSSYEDRGNRFKDLVRALPK